MAGAGRGSRVNPVPTRTLIHDRSCPPPLGMRARPGLLQPWASPCVEIWGGHGARARQSDGGVRWAGWQGGEGVADGGGG
jgi:hypothetical protein